MNQLISRNLAQSQKRRESNTASINQFSPDDFLLSGQLLIDGAGEVLVDVNFPVSFEEVPLFSFGGAMDETSPITQGSYPRISAVVLRWNFTELPLRQRRIYRGASIAVVTEGSATQKMWLHWHFTGHAFVNPVDNNGAVDQTL